MRSRTLTALVLILAVVSIQSPAKANDEGQKQIIIGSPTPLHLFGTSLGAITTSEVFGILPPCDLGVSNSYKTNPCVRAVQYRALDSSKWLDAELRAKNLHSLAETQTAIGNYNPVLEYARGADGRDHLNGGSSSLWGMKKESGGEVLFVVEATVASTVKPKTFSLSLVPVEVTATFSNDLAEERKSALRRIPFPMGYQYQVIIKQGYSMQPLQFVTSRTKASEVINNAGPNVSVPDFVFRGEPDSHSVLASQPIACSDTLTLKMLGKDCDSIPSREIKIYPWDRAILSFLDDATVDAMSEDSTVMDWSFQGGQDSALIKDFVTGCGFSNLFSITSTNAPIYHINPPRWDAKERTLSMKVANTHLNSASEPQIGRFSITLRLSSAACMWGIDSKNATASVEVISENGTAQRVATSSIKVDTTTDSVSINLSGFTFSSPTIKLRLVSAPNTQVAMPLTPGSSEKKVICVKGKQIAKVSKRTGLCPAGFKQKK